MCLPPQGPKTTIKCDNSPKCLAKKIRIESRKYGYTKTQLLGYKNTAETKHSFYPDIRAKHSRGCKHISVMCIKCNIFNSILIFVSNIWGVEPYFWDFLFILIFVPNTWEVETYFWEMCTTQCFSFYPDIRANHLGGGGLQYISGMCIKPIAKIEWSM